MRNLNQFILKIRSPIVYLAVWHCFIFVLVFLFVLFCFFLLVWQFAFITAAEYLKTKQKKT